MLIGIKLNLKIEDVNREVTRYDARTGDSFKKTGKGVQIILTIDSPLFPGEMFLSEGHEIYEGSEGYEFHYTDWKHRFVYEKITTFFEKLNVKYGEENTNNLYLINKSRYLENK